MTWIHPDWVEHQRQRFMRPDAQRYWRPDAERLMPRETLKALGWRDPNETAQARGPSANEDSAEDQDYRIALARLRLDWELLKLAIKAQKDGFNAAQPRDDWGRWTDGFRIVAAGMPRIPQRRPPDSTDRTAIYRKIATWAAENGPAILEGIAKTSWLYPALPTIWSYLDAPKSLEELQDDLSPKPGYDVHHIVERSSATEDGYPSKRIDGVDNLVRIPRMKHWEINAWYQTRNPNFDDATPRDYLRGKDWDERRRIGLKALKTFKVLMQ